MKINAKILLSVILLLFIGHLAILLQILPYNIVWGGKLKSVAEMYFFEIVSALITLVFGFVVAIKANVINIKLPKNILQSVLWFFFFFFILNTIGNLLSKTYTEKLFSIVTMVFVLLLWKLLKSKE
jgi:hypothetical protein